MLAHPTPAQAFPGAAQQQALYFARHPGWYAWATASTTLWQAATTLDTRGLTLAQQISRVAAWVLDGLLTQAPAQVSLWLVLTPAVTAAWQTWAALAQLTAPAAPTQTVILTPGAQGALQTLQAWDPVRQLHVPPNPEALMVTLAQGLSVSATQNVSAVPAAGVLLHQLTTTDTLWRLAAQYLGDPEQWPQIRALNQLRAPYLSDRLWDQYGPPLAAWEVTTGTATAGYPAAPPIAAGATTVTLPGLTTVDDPLQGILVCEQWTLQGRQQEAHTISGFDAATATVTLESALTASYGSGALVSLNLAPAYQTTQVLAPGQWIQIPRTGATASTQLPVPQDPLGTDLAVTAAGQLQWTATGDLATVGGITNLLAALGRRLDSALGTLPLHPQYGSGLPTVIGDPVISPAVVESYVTLTLLQDPRVQAVTAVTVTARGSTWQVTATIQPVSLTAPVTTTTTLTA
jgi:phage baseplate assembly protein W